MPSYKYECPYCGATTRETRKVDDRNKPMPCGCGCKVSMIRVYEMPYISADARPTSRPDVARANEREREWSQDMGAYKRMRDQGLQPRRVAGAADLESRAETQTELKMGKVMPTRDVKAGVELSSQMLQRDVEL